MTWIDEVYQGSVRTGFKLRRRLFKGRSPHQLVEVVETKAHGRLLLIDGMTMVSERDEFVYHEMMAHVPLFLHPRPRRVLVIGGGDGGTVREVLKHRCVERVVLAELDPLVVEASRKFIPKTAAKLSDRRVDVRIGDGVKYLAETSESFDVVLVDSTEPFGPAKELFGPKFYRDVRRVLTPDGIVVSQAGSPFYELSTVKNLLKLLKPVFPIADAYLFGNLTYPGGLWAFTYASKRRKPLSLVDRRVRAAGLSLSWYNPDVHRAAFAWPEFMRKELGR